MWQKVEVVWVDGSVRLLGASVSKPAMGCGGSKAQPASEVDFDIPTPLNEFYRPWLVGEFAHRGWQHLEMDLFGNASFAEISLSSFNLQGSFSSLCHKSHLWRDLF